MVERYAIKVDIKIKRALKKAGQPRRNTAIPETGHEKLGIIKISGSGFASCIHLGRRKKHDLRQRLCS